MEGRKNITIYDIAKEAGVSVATVSRVLTQSARVSEEKRVRIQSIIEKYEFQPNALAKGLSETKSNMIGMIVSDIRNPFYGTLFVECEKVANQLGYMVLLCNSLGDNCMEEKHLKNLVNQRVDAVIQIGGCVDELLSNMSYVEHINKVANRIPVIITGKLDGADCYQVNIDEAKSMELIMEYLLSMGHARIALVGGRNNVKSTVEKRLRYKQILNRYGIEYRDEFVVDSLHYDEEGGYEGMKKLFTLHTMPTAVIAINDYSAIGVMRAIMEKGLSIPNDISVASFDNTYLTDVTVPRLTAVSYNYKQFGETLVTTAVAAIQKKEIPRITVVPPELVVKNSCKKKLAEEVM